MVVATMVVVMFGRMFRYDDVSRLLWRNVLFVEAMIEFKISFDKRNNVKLC